ncbi:hypothetical protein ACEU6N_15525 [Enterobacter hormaechei]|uniref:hypothetical protein n=1 Tax=Enterobacter hormaechei TaxID=158836 RepID=UPI0035A6B862
MRLIIILILCLSVPVDMVNGWLSYERDIGLVSPLYKAAVLGLCLFLLAVLKLKRFLVYAFFIFFLCLGPVLGYTTFSLDEFPVETVQIAIRCLLMFVVYDTLAAMKVSHRMAAFGAVSALSFTLLNFLLAQLGYGYSAYGDAALNDAYAEYSVGAKGFFFAGNEVSILLMFLAAFVSLYFYKYFWTFFLLVALLGCSILLSTKTAMIASLAMVAVWFFVRYRSLSVKYLIPAAIVAIFALIFIINPDINLSGAKWTQFVYIYENGGITRLIFSGRDEFVDAAWRMMQGNDAFITGEYFFGFTKEYLEFQRIKSSVEIDLIDMYLWFGVAGVVFFFYYMKFVWSKVKYGCYETRMSRLISLCFFTMIFFVSFFSGHVVYSGTAAIPAALCLYAIYQKIMTHK